MPRDPERVAAAHENACRWNWCQPVFCRPIAIRANACRALFYQELVCQKLVRQAKVWMLAYRLRCARQAAFRWPERSLVTVTGGLRQPSRELFPTGGRARAGVDLSVRGRSMPAADASRIHFRGQPIDRRGHRRGVPGNPGRRATVPAAPPVSRRTSADRTGSARSVRRSRVRGPDATGPYRSPARYLRANTGPRCNPKSQKTLSDPRSGKVFLLWS